MSRFAARPALALLGTTLLALTLAAAPTPAASASTAPERVILSPTADPATSQTLPWRSQGSAAPALQIARASAPDRVTTVQGTDTGSASGTFHAATATGLSPDTTYRYRVGDGTAFSPWRTFTTATQGAEPFTFLYFGDVQNGISTGAATVVRAALAAEPDAELAVHSGDLIDSPNSESQWSEWFDAFGPQATGTMNHVATPGNHEYSLTSLSRYWTPQFPGAGNGPTRGTHLPQTVYHTDYQGVRFIVLNSNYRNAAPLSPPPGSTPSDVGWRRPLPPTPTSGLSSPSTTRCSPTAPAATTAPCVPPGCPPWKNTTWTWSCRATTTPTPGAT